ncbi:MAG: FHA domain-containing protein [Anaerolineales bacterium]|nr:FHA domain-containing protein [Anaerolineales bacterium]
MVEGDAETRATPVAHLILLGTEGEPQRWPIREGSLTLGRAKDCHISIADTRLSRRHTELRCEGRRVIITDLGSINGTFVNGARIEQPQELRHGDLVRVGPFELRCEMLIPPEPEIPERSTIVMEEPSRLPRLEVSSGSQRGLVIDLTRVRMVVGRSGRGQQWDIVLLDRAVSRPHAEILRQGEGFVLKDLGSANATLVNGVALTGPHELIDGDAITFGEAVLVFRAGAA